MNISTSNRTKIIHGPAFRPVLVWIICLRGTVALAAVISVLGINPAWSATPAASSVTVSFRDLDLSSPAGANTLYLRIQAAAKRVCGYAGGDFIERRIWQACYRNAIADAVGKVNSPLLTAVHTGRPPAVTAMVLK